MKGRITIFLLVCCCTYQFVATKEVNQRSISHKNQIILRPHFVKDSFSYGLCDNLGHYEGRSTNCSVYKVSNIFGKSDKLKKCQFEISDVDLRNCKVKQCQTLDPDHAVVILSSGDFIGIRFEDCKYFRSDFKNDDRSKIKKKFQDLGINLDKIFEGGFGFYIYPRGQIVVEGSFDARGNYYADRLYGLTSHVEKARQLDAELGDWEADAKRHNDQYSILNPIGDLKRFRELYYITPLSAANNFFTYFKTENDMDKIKQLDQNGKISVSHSTSNIDEPVLAVYNLLSGGFYMLTDPSDIEGTRLSRVDVNGKRTHVRNVEDVQKMAGFQNGVQEFYFEQNVNRNLCLKWIQYKNGKIKGKIEWYTKCFDNIDLTSEAISLESDVKEREIQFHNKEPFIPSFKDDIVAYGLCDERQNKTSPANCTFYLVNYIFEISDRTQKCNILTKNIDPKFDILIESQPLDKNHALFKLSADVLIAIRLDDCKYVQISPDREDMDKTREELREIGIDLDTLTTDSTVLYTNYQNELRSLSNWDRNRDDSQLLYPSLRRTVETRYSSRRPNYSIFFFYYNDNGELKRIYGLNEGSSRRDFFGGYGYQTVLESDTNYVKQFNRNGRIHMTTTIDYYNEPILAIYNLPGGGFYVLTAPTNIEATRLSKVNVKGERTIIKDLLVRSDKINLMSNKFKFSENKDGDLCLRWTEERYRYEFSGIFKWSTKCFVGTKIVE